MKSSAGEDFSRWQRRNIALSSLACVLFVLISVMLLRSKGGIDLLTYSRNSEIPLGEWGGYFLKEIVSWIFIVFSFRVSDEIFFSTPLLVLNLGLLFFTLIILRNTSYRASFIVFVLVSPFSILLVFNVLRQYLAVVFFLLAICSYLSGNKKTWLVLCLMSILCHHSICFLIAIFFFSVIFNRRSVFFLIFAVQVVIFMANSLLGLGVYEGGVNDSGSVGGWVKTLVSLGYVVALYSFVRWVMHKCGSNVRRVEIKFIDGLFLFSLVILFFPWQTWMVGRFLVYVAFIYLGYFYLIMVGSSRSKVSLGVVVIFFFFNFGLIFLHSGAFDMLRWYT